MRSKRTLLKVQEADLHMWFLAILRSYYLRFFWTFSRLSQSPILQGFKTGVSRTVNIISEIPSCLSNQYLEYQYNEDDFRIKFLDSTSY